jgi:hypothetical protein
MDDIPKPPRSLFRPTMVKKDVNSTQPLVIIGKDRKYPLFEELHETDPRISINEI